MERVCNLFIAYQYICNHKQLTYLKTLKQYVINLQTYKATYINTKTKFYQLFT